MFYHTKGYHALSHQTPSCPTLPNVLHVYYMWDTHAIHVCCFRFITHVIHTPVIHVYTSIMQCTCFKHVTQVVGWLVE